MNTKTELEPWT